jgi:probable phosphoglycerate mutase
MLVSDTGRALATARIINEYLKIPQALDSRLREQNWGRWVGLTVAQVKAVDPLMLEEQVNAGWDFCPPGGESRYSVLKRSLEALREAAARYSGENLLVVSHEGVVKGLIYHLCGRKFLPDEPAILKSYQLHWLIHNEGIQIEKLNAMELDS